MNPSQAYQTQQGTQKPKKKPCCKSLWKKDPWEQGSLLTEYQKEYPGKYGGPSSRVNPLQPALRVGGSFHGDTTYGNNYQSWEPNYAGRVRPVQALNASDAPLDPWTTYKVDYPAKAVPYERVKAAHTAITSPGAFDPNTTHKNDFKDPGPVYPMAPVQARSVSVPRGGGAFDGHSLYKDDYKRHPLVRTMAAAPARAANAALPHGAFDDATMYRTTYTPKDAQPAGLIRPSDTALPKDGWYEGMAPSTEYKTHYFGKDARPASRAGPTTRASGTVLTNGPFDGRTTYGGDFRPVTAPAYVRARRPGEGERESLPFYGQTTYGGDFVRKSVPYERIKAVNALSPSAGPFDDSTTQKAAYQDWGVQPVVAQTIRGTVSVRPDQGPFEGLSTYKKDFTKMPNGRRNPAARPTSGTRQLAARGPFDDTTTYRMDYVPKEFDVSLPRRPGSGYCESCDSSPDCVDDC